MYGKLFFNVLFVNRVNFTQIVSWHIYSHCVGRKTMKFDDFIKKKQLPQYIFFTKKFRRNAFFRCNEFCIATFFADVI